MEIERKFLVEYPPDLTPYEKKRYVQAYISTSPVIRLRDEGGVFVLCIKGEGLLSREEFELTLTKEQFDNLWAKVETNAVEKDRYFIPYKDFLIELDIYLGFHKGLIVGEVEFENLTDAEAFTPPSWFSKEVTEDVRYKNAYLANNAAIGIKNNI